jgi:UDP-galactopyranose mutase
MSRFAHNRRVFFLEEPLFEDGEPRLRSTVCAKSGVRIYTPVLPPHLTPRQTLELQQKLLKSMIAQNDIEDYIAWYYTPMARQFTSSLHPRLTVYDCMDELSAFAGAPPEMRENEKELFREADLVFTGGASLYASKCKQHPSVHLFPSSVDVAHFARALSAEIEPDDQSRLPHPRLGYAGVIDERMDLELLKEVATKRPNWQLVLLGPVVKIDPATLPQLPNIHYLGMKSYADLPSYFSGWDIGMLPFAMNESTRFISPTKTPEYLAAGLRVVSTPIRDVVSPYGDLGLVRIADGAREFVSAVEALLKDPDKGKFHAAVQQFLAEFSWDKTWNGMNSLIEEKIMLKNLTLGSRQPAPSIEISAEGAAHV